MQVLRICSKMSLIVMFHWQRTVMGKWCATTVDTEETVAKMPVLRLPLISEGFRAGTQQIEELVNKGISAGKGSSDGSGYYEDPKKDIEKILSAFAK